MRRKFLFILPALLLVGCSHKSSTEIIPTSDESAKIIMVNDIETSDLIEIPAIDNTDTSTTKTDIIESEPVNEEMVSYNAVEESEETLGDVSADDMVADNAEITAETQNETEKSVTEPAQYVPKEMPEKQVQEPVVETNTEINNVKPEEHQLKTKHVLKSMVMPVQYDIFFRADGGKKSAGKNITNEYYMFNRRLTYIMCYESKDDPTSNYYESYVLDLSDFNYVEMMNKYVSSYRDAIYNDMRLNKDVDKQKNYIDSNGHLYIKDKDCCTWLKNLVLTTGSPVLAK